MLCRLFTADAKKRTLRMGCVLEREVERERELSLTSVVDSGDGVSIEHAVEEGVGVFRELRDDRESAGSRTVQHTHTQNAVKHTN